MDVDAPPPERALPMDEAIADRSFAIRCGRATRH